MDPRPGVGLPRLELFEDSDLQSQVNALFADAKDQLEAVAFTTGNGTTEPEGVIAGVLAVGGSIIVVAAGATLGLADVINSQNSLPHGRAPARCSWPT